MYYTSFVLDLDVLVGIADPDFSPSIKHRGRLRPGLCHAVICFYMCIKVKAPIAGRLRKCHSIFCINRFECDAESRIAAIILMYVSSLL